MKKAIIIVDVQNDFITGSLAVPGAEEIIPVINNIQKKFDLVVTTQDFHPSNHGSFAPSPDKIGTIINLNGLDQILWPVHCVQNSDGAEFHKELNLDQLDANFTKGTNPDIDSYSGFFDNGKKQDTGLDAYLKDQNVDEVYVCGLATDYCVKFTAVDAADLGYKTYLINDASRGVNINPNDVENAIEDMKKKGIKIVNAEDI